MATAKRISVSKTGGSNSTVYSYGDVYKAYNMPGDSRLVEGQAKTNTYAPGDADPTASDVTSVTAVTAGTTSGLSAATAVVAATTTVTGNGAGLIVSFTTQADGVANATPGNYTVVNGGDGYATGNTVSIDGFPGSVLTVSIA